MTRTQNSPKQIPPTQHAEARHALHRQSANLLTLSTRQRAHYANRHTSDKRDVNYTTGYVNTPTPHANMILVITSAFGEHYANTHPNTTTPNITFKILKRTRDTLRLHIEEAYAIQTKSPQLYRRDEHLGMGFLI